MRSSLSLIARRMSRFSFSRSRLRFRHCSEHSLLLEGKNNDEQRAGKKNELRRCGTQFGEIVLQFLRHALLASDLRLQPLFLLSFVVQIAFQVSETLLITLPLGVHRLASKGRRGLQFEQRGEEPTSLSGRCSPRGDRRDLCADFSIPRFAFVAVFRHSSASPGFD